MGMAAPVYYSAEMVRNLPDDGKRYETVHGELLVTPAPLGAPTHRSVFGACAGRLRRKARTMRGGSVPRRYLVEPRHARTA